MRLAVLAPESSATRDRLHLVAPPGSGIELAWIPPRVNAFARTPYDHVFAQLGYIDAAERAHAAGCDAIFLDTFGDYGMAAIRAAVPEPVIGAGEAGIAMAAAGGAFSIVTVWPASMSFLYAERLAASPGGERCVQVHHFSGEDELDRYGSRHGIVQRLSGRQGSLVDDLAAAVGLAAAEDGVEQVLLGCTCMAPIAPELASRLGEIHVIDASKAGFDAAVAALDGRPPRTAHQTTRPGSVGDLVDRYLGDRSGPPLDALAAEECEMCVTLVEPEALTDPVL